MTRFTTATNIEDTDGMSRHRFTPYNAAISSDWDQCHSYSTLMLLLCNTHMGNDIDDQQTMTPSLFIMCLIFICKYKSKMIISMWCIYHPVPLSHRQNKNVFSECWNPLYDKSPSVSIMSMAVVNQRARFSKKS